MTLRERLQTIGRKLLGSQIESQVIKTKEKSILGGVIDVFESPSLVTPTKASSKLIKANQGWVYKNNDVIAKEVGTIEFELFSTRIVGEEIVFNPILSHPILDVLDRFNEFTSASDGFYLTESHKNLAGDAFWYIDGRGTNIKGLYILQPDKVTLELGDPKAGQRIIQSYRFEDSVEGQPIKETYSAKEIIHFKDPNPENQYRGKSKVEAAAEAIDTDNFAVEANKGLFKRGLITNFILTTENRLNDEQLKRLRAEMQSNYGGAKNAYKVPIFSGGLKPEAIQMTNRDMEFIAQQKWLRDKIMSIFGNTLAVLGITEDVNRANAEATILNWKRTTIKAEMKSLTDTLNEFLVPRFGSNLILTFKDPVPEDESSKIEKATKLKNADLISINEAREIISYEPTAGGEELGFQRTERQQAQASSVPSNLKNIDLTKHLRRTGIYRELEAKKKIKDAARDVARKMLKDKKTTTHQEHDSFTNEVVWTFHNKQIRIVEAQEKIFENKVKQFIDRLVKQAITKVPEEVKGLFNEDDEVLQATIDFKPILMEVALLSGQQALSLIGNDNPYIPIDLSNLIERNVNKFAVSMIQTDREKITEIISSGLSNGDSVSKIRRTITETFEEFSKMQAERITRTEVIRASNYGALDAWENSGVVTAKQWLTALDDRVDPLCEAMNGRVINLQKNFFDKGDTFTVGDATTKFEYGSVRVPPLHPNCRCTLLPVLKDQKTFDTSTYLRIKVLEEQKKELEAKVDKRSKKYRDIISRNLELQDYVKELEGFIGDR